jgi:PPOX class probable F420-dependent enzyme
VAKARDAVRMTDEEVAAFLEGALKVQVATIGPHGEPHLTTLFYVLDEGRIVFWTYGRSQKIANLRRDDRITCLVEDGRDYVELRGVSISGRARLVEESEDVVRIGSRIATRMADGADLGAYGDDLVRQQARKRVGVVVDPEKVASWDHGKMAGSS